MSLESVLLLVILTIIASAIAAFFAFRSYFEKRAEAQVSDRLSLVLSAESLLALEHDTGIILNKINAATATASDAQQRVKALSGITKSAEIKAAIAELEKEVLALKKEYGTKVEKLAGAIIYPPEPASNSNSGNNKGQQGQQANSGASKITKAAEAATASLGRKVEFSEIWSAVREADSSVKKMEDFNKLDGPKQDGLISAAQIRLSANANTNGTGA